MKILIIDDEKGLLKMYSEYLSAQGINVLNATDGASGIKMAREEKPELIFLDIIMPRYNGLDVLKDMKKDPVLKDVPVYLLTNLPADSSGDKAKELGASGYFVKAEYEPKMLLDLVNEATAKKE